MPANLTPQYLDAEKKYREARTIPEKISALEEMLAIVPKHKGSEKLQKELKTRLSKLRQSQQKKAATARRSSVPTIRPEGAGQVFLIGPPNSGKSSLLAELTNAGPDIGEYPFTTRTLNPGMMPYEDIQIQLVDTPAISPEHTETWLSSPLRNTDGILAVLSLGTDRILEEYEEIFNYLNQVKIQTRPDSGTGPGWVFIPALLILNQADLDPGGERLQIFREFYRENLPFFPVSTADRSSRAGLPREIFQLLDIIRVYSKSPGKPADLSHPTIVKTGCTALEFTNKIHKDFREKFKYARLWRKKRSPGPEKETVSPDGLRISRDYQLQDGDIIEIHA